MISLTTEEQVQKNKEDILVLSKSCEDCEKAMEGGIKRVEKNQERSDKRMSAIFVTMLVILGGVIATLVAVAIK